MADRRWEKAEPWVRFFEEHLTHTKGKYARDPFLLNHQWQREIILDVFGQVKSNGMRKFQTAYIEMGKKNGKTELAAGIALGGLLIDDEPGAEVYLAASTREQASICFRVAAQMVRNSPRLNRMCRIVDSTKTILKRKDPNCFLKAISADAGTQDGINPSIAVFDELHRQKNSDLWDVLAYGMATRRQPLLFAITTAGILGESPICEVQHDYAKRVSDGVFADPSFYPALYSLDNDDDWTLEGEPAHKGRPATGWYKANPSLGSFCRSRRCARSISALRQIPHSRTVSGGSDCVSGWGRKPDICRWKTGRPAGSRSGWICWQGSHASPGWTCRVRRTSPHSFWSLRSMDCISGYLTSGCRSTNCISGRAGIGCRMTSGLRRG